MFKGSAQSMHAACGGVTVLQQAASCKPFQRNAARESANRCLSLQSVHTTVQQGNLALMSFHVRLIGKLIHE